MLFKLFSIIYCIVAAIFIIISIIFFIGYLIFYRKKLKRLRKFREARYKNELKKDIKV